MAKTRITNDEASAAATGMMQKAYGKRLEELKKKRNAAGDSLFLEVYGIPSNHGMDLFSRNSSAYINGVTVYCSCSVPAVMSRKGDYDHFGQYCKLSRMYNETEYDANEFRGKIRKALENLRTINKIREQLPEAMDFIVLDTSVKSSNALALRYDGLREMFNKMVKENG